MYTKEDLVAIKELVNPADLLTSLGGVCLSDISDYGNEIRTYCPLHGGDNKSSFCWYRDTGSWACYSKSCGEGTAKDVFSFVSLKLNVSFYEAVTLVADLVGYRSNKPHPEMETSKLSVSETMGYYNTLNKYKVEFLEEISGLPGYYKQGFDTVIKYLDLRGYKYQDIKEFRLYPHLDSCGLLRLGIPVYDEFSRLVGINARLMDSVIDYPQSVTDSFGNTVTPPKYKMVKFKKGSCLYNLNRARSSSVAKGIIIVEGQLDVIRLYTYGIFNAVCTMGTTLTAKQVSLLYKYAYHVVFLVEEGEAAMAGVMRSIKSLNNPMKISVAVLPSGDADSNSKEAIVKALTTAKTLPISAVDRVASKC